jgi:hypothetical protein
MKRRAIVCWLSVLLLLAPFVLPARAGPLDQTGTKTYRNPAWVLTLEYPASWSMEDPAGDVVGFSSDPSGSADVSGVCLVTRSVEYAAPGYTPDDLFLNVMNKIDGTANDFASAPAGVRRVGGIDADVVSFTATNSSGTKLEGNVYRLVKGRYGYGIIIASSVDNWKQHQSSFDAILDSVQLGATPPSKTPTRTPTRTPRRPPATPTLEPTRAAPAGLTSAREAYDLARPDAEEWSPDAVLAELDCTGASLEGAAAGKCHRWDFKFMFSADAEITDLGYEVIVAEGERDSTQGGEDYLLLSDALGTDWLDSTEAVQAFLDDGGRKFLDENPEAGIVDLSLYYSNNGPMWTVRAVAEGGTRAEFAREIDAATGEVQG